MADPAADQVLRAMTNDGALRVLVASTTRSCQGAIDAQSVKGKLAEQVGELLTGAALFRETMAPNLRVQCLVRGSKGSGQIIADSHPDGWLRSLLRGPGEALTFGEGSIVHLMRSLPNGELQQGVVEVPEGGGISEGFMSVMHHSEQIVTVIRLACEMDGEKVVRAGGYLVQLLPEAPDREEAVQLITDRLGGETFSDIKAHLKALDGDPQKLLEVLLEGMEWTPLANSGLRFGCDCSKSRVLASLATLDRSEVQSMVDDGEALDMSCELCGRRHIVEISELRGLLVDS